MDWREELSQNVRSVSDLQAYIPLNERERTDMERLLDDYPMSVTRYYLSLIDFNDPDDPIRKMAIPSPEEAAPGGSFDTSGEAGNTVMNGLQHKYSETAMMLSCNECAMYCRHCFRKRLVGVSEEEVARDFDAMKGYLSSRPEINNVLVSGGDALLNTSSRLRRIFGMLADIPSLDVIRICTRVPVVFPQRIIQDTELTSVLAEAAQHKRLLMVTQFNHPRELTREAVRALHKVRLMGIPVLNQTVLLRGVNDSAEVLVILMRNLVRAGVQPYYIFQCRPVRGVKNRFQIPLRRGWQIVQQAKNSLSGIGKTFRYCMSHVTGKLEILAALSGGDILFQYHEASERRDLGRVLRLPVAEDQCWLGDIAPLGQQ